VIEKNGIAFSHRAQIISRRVIPDACPRRLSVRDEIRPRISRRFLFHEPELFHRTLPSGDRMMLQPRLDTVVVRGRGLEYRMRDSTTAFPCFTLDHMARGAFITFEGSEGCGKSTQVVRLASRFEQTSVPTLITREPGGTPIGEKIRDLLQFAPESFAMTAEAELLLFEASRSQLVREIIEPALTQGTVVISDRFFDSTTVYQGVARRLPPDIVETLNTFAVGATRPNLTFILDVDVETARARMLRRVRPVAVHDRMEQEPLDFYERVCQGYRTLAAREPDRFIVIDGRQSADAIETQIWDALTQRLPAVAPVSRSQIENPKSKI
jgi:dTMP kinase